MAKSKDYAKSGLNAQVNFRCSRLFVSKKNSLITVMVQYNWSIKTVNVTLRRSKSCVTFNSYFFLINPIDMK